MTISEIAALVPWVLAGGAIGTVYFLLLGRSVSAFGAEVDWRKAAGFLVLRLGIAIAGFFWIAQAGALPLLTALAGLMFARSLVLRRARSV